jgi:hypothetical protein
LAPGISGKFYATDISLKTATEIFLDNSKIANLPYSSIRIAISQALGPSFIYPLGCDLPIAAWENGPHSPHLL